MIKGKGKGRAANTLTFILYALFLPSLQERRAVNRSGHGLARPQRFPQNVIQRVGIGAIPIGEIELGGSHGARPRLRVLGLRIGLRRSGLESPQVRVALEGGGINLF